MFMLRLSKLYRLKNATDAGFCLLFLCFISLIFPACGTDAGSGKDLAAHLDSSVKRYAPYEVYKLPITKGVTILNPIQLTLGTDGRIYASNHSGEIYTLVDTDRDGLEDSAALYIDLNTLGLHSAASMAFRGDTAYIAAREEIRAFVDRDRSGQPDTNWTVFREIPYSAHPYEWTSGLTATPDGWLYFALTTDSWNAGASPDPGGYRGSILRVRVDGSKVERVATGIRSVHGMAQHTDGRIFFIDNAGGGNPTEELNLLIPGSFYGHNKKKFTDTTVIAQPMYSLLTDIAPSQVRFPPAGTASASPDELFVAFYGPAERWSRGAIGKVRIRASDTGGMQFEESPIADIPKLSGLAFGADGALYAAHHGVADYWYNSIEPRSGGFYKLVYNPSVSHAPAKDRILNKDNPTTSAIEKGKILFKDRACFACHSAEKDEDLLGPPLRGIGQRLSRDEILAEINEPSRIIKSSMGATRITKKNGQILLGRIVSIDAESISLMIIGNSIQRIPRHEILKTEDERKSLMYEKLLNGLSPEEANQLIDYLVSLR